MFVRRKFTGRLLKGKTKVTNEREREKMVSAVQAGRTKYASRGTKRVPVFGYGRFERKRECKNSGKHEIHDF